MCRYTSARERKVHDRTRKWGLRSFLIQRRDKIMRVCWVLVEPLEAKAVDILEAVAEVILL